MEFNNGLEVTKIDRNTVFDALSSDIKEYSLRVARNAQIVYSQIVEKQMFDEYSDVDMKYIKHISDIVKYFDIGYAFKDDKTLFPNKILPIFHVKKGADVFFADIKKREDFKGLTDYEKYVRRVAKEVAYYHHERWDGGGYPEGLKKEEIPLLARITSICLAFETMTYDYKTNTKRPKAEAIEYLTKEAGRSFDPSIVLLVLEIVDLLAVHGEDYLTYDEIQNEKYDELNLEVPQEVSNPIEQSSTEVNEEAKEEIVKNEIDEDLEFDDVTEEDAAIDLLDTDPLVKTPESEKVENPKEKKRTKPARAIEMLFMPVYDIKTESVVYYQSRLMVNDKKLGPLMPNVYSLVAEKTNKLAKLLEIGLDQVILFIKLADILEYKVDCVSVRLYAKIVERPTVIKKIVNQILKSGIDPSRIILEIPETVLAGANEKTAETLKNLKELGFKIAMAEFGFAYSSLHKLSDIEFDILKINREYILDVDSNSRSAGIVRSIIDMVRTLGAEEVCEGVDREDQKQALIKIGCRKVQGSVVGEPKTSKDLLGF